ncbi:MAG: SDR family oxidoreductase [Streptococcus equinus]|nr:SDR family oxidoreductase [Streptococcus equinus]MBE6162301.1 SDR family oxidoreductase [Streptococcus equinus]
MKLKSFLKKKLVKVKKEKVLIPCLEGKILQGKRALITGGSSGIGYAIAKSFLKNGASVVICGRNSKRLEDAKNSLVVECECSSNNITILELDISSVDSMTKILNNFLKDNQVEIFVNNAGVNFGRVFPETSEEDYDNVLNTNLKGMYFISQLIAKYMVKNNIKGNILNITSSSSLRPGISPYIVSKWGERSLTLGMAKKYLPYGIIVNGLAPGSTLTPMLKTDSDNNLNLDYSPSKRYAAPEEIGNLATILVSDMGRMIVGDTIYATGGAGVITYDDATY